MGGGRWMLKMHASHNVSGIRNKQDAGLFLGLKQALTARIIEAYL